MVGWLVGSAVLAQPEGGRRARGPLSERGESVTCPARNSPPGSAGQFADPPKGGVIPQTTAQAYPASGVKGGNLEGPGGNNFIFE